MVKFKEGITKKAVTDCATEIQVFLSDHRNWVQPILPIQPGCPEVTFDPEVFPHVWDSWYCDASAGVMTGRL